MRIFETKQSVSVQELCSGLPLEFQDYLVYCRGLRYAEDPDYDYLRGLFRSVMTEYNLVNDGVFDWMEDSGPRQPLTPFPISAGRRRAHCLLASCIPLRRSTRM